MGVLTPSPLTSPANAFGQSQTALLPPLASHCRSARAPRQSVRSEQPTSTVAVRGKLKFHLFQMIYIRRANEYLPYHSTLTLLRTSTTLRAHFGDVSGIVNSSILFLFLRLSEVARLFRRVSRNRRPQYPFIHIFVTNRSCVPVTANAGKLQISPHFSPTNQYSRGIAFNLKPSLERKVA